ncbi:MAG: FAD-dependent oxidoreductase [Ilumatobacteraceae bacterium]|jgi:glycerol-3-phosphate dehydrogenase
MDMRPAISARRDSLDRLQSEAFDLLVVGGGITGAGVALDAAARGLRVAIVDQNDFASGTSSKSSKLIHGGLRYLQQGDVALVYEALHERQRLLRNAPHLVRTLPFMIPVMTRDGVVSRKIARALGSALWMYDLTGGWRVGRLHRRLRAKKALAHMPTMRADRLSSAYLYFDAEADDARLTLALVQSAIERGAVAVNYCTVTSLLKKSTEGSPHRNEQISGATVRTYEGRTVDIRARVVVNATGVWGDAMRRMDIGGDVTTIRPAKGIHITVPWELVQNDIAVVIPVPGDKRSLFVVPHMPNGDGTYRFTYVGTTDTDYQGSIDDPQCTEGDIDYCLRALNNAVAGSRAITRDDVVGTWAGLRPLVVSSDGEAATGRTADLSRRHKVMVSDSGMVTITGGKLTTYRKMAEHTVDAALDVMRDDGTASDIRAKRCATKRLALHGATSHDRDDHLVSRFGTLASSIREMITLDPALGAPLIEGLPYLRAEAVYCARHELVVTLEDVLSRRLRGLLYDRHATEAAAESTARLIAPELGWDELRINAEVQKFSEICAHEVAAARA